MRDGVREQEQQKARPCNEGEQRRGTTSVDRNVPAISFHPVQFMNRWLLAITGESRSSLRAILAVRSMAQERWLAAALNGSAPILPNLLDVARGSVASFDATS